MKYFSIIFLIVLVIFTSCGTYEDGKIPIAILTPVTHPSLEQIEQGFKQTMGKEKYRFTTFNAQGNKTLLRSEIEEIANQNYALVFTIGTTASQMTKEVFEKKHLQMPIVFTCVNNPEGFNMISPNVTGVKEMLHFDKEIAALLQYKPDIRSIMLVYNPSEPGLYENQQTLSQILSDYDIVLKSVEVFKTNEIYSKVSPFMQEVDAMVVLKDNTVVSGLDVLIKLCNRYTIPLMASDLDSPIRGAAFGYGVHEISFGVEGAKKALQIIEENISPNKIPITPVSNFVLKVNSEAAARQGVILP